MPDYKQITIDYIEGRIGASEFLHIRETDSGLTEWLQSLVPEGMTMTVWRDERVQVLPYKVFEDINVRHKPGTIGHTMDTQDGLYNLLKGAFPDITIVKDQALRDKFSIMLDLTPDWIGGAEYENSGLFEKILAEVPEGTSKTKRNKYVKARLKEYFQCEKSWPRWIQEPEWPFCNGKPMKFVKTVAKIRGEWYCHHFIDIETGEEKVVEEFF